MRIFRDLATLDPSKLRAPAVTIGVFDGVHRGHRHLFDELRAVATRAGGDAVVVTFDRHPRAVVGGGAPPLITSLEHRLVLFERAGIDAAVVLTFDEALSRLSADEFLDGVLIGKIGARAIVLGADSHFGRGRAGNVAFLGERRARLGYELVSVPLVPASGGSAGAAVSSTAIRKAVADGRLDDAAAMLGRPASVLGRIDRGERRGRTIGFPTANLSLHNEVCPPRGVYLARVEVDRVRFPALVNIGVRPTFRPPGGDTAQKEKIEAHLLGFDGDLYGRVLEVEFVRRLRDERRFESVEALVAQIGRDREEALALADEAS